MSDPSPTADFNLLFGVLALQADLIDERQFAEACKSWSVGQGQPLADLLIERGWITMNDKVHVEYLLQRKLQKHAGNVAASLAAATCCDVRHVLAHLGPATIDQSQATPPLSDAAPSSTIDSSPESRERYTLTRLHAKGGIGQVWLARDRDLGRDVALKELRPEHAGSPALAARFFQEAKITGQLEHPSIVPVYELAQRTENQKPFYTMRFIKGRTLSDACKTHHDQRADGQMDPLQLRELLGAFVAVCNAVAYAHARGVIHRDLKGSNVVLGDFGEVMVLDWGLAKVLGEPEARGAGEAAVTNRLTTLNLGSESTRDQTKHGQVLGTPGYMAPEQADGRLDLIDRRTDIYGLGAILYQILTGQAPFSGGETYEVLRRIVQDAPVRPRAVVAATPPALEAICLKALAKRPGERYASAGALADDVQRWLADEPVTVYREPWLPRLVRWGRRHRPWVAGAAALLLTVVAALVIGLVAVNREKNRTAAEQQRTQEALEAEAKARRRTRQALDEMSSQVIENWLARQGSKLEPAQEEFLKKALASYQEFAAEAGDSEEVRIGVAKAHHRIGNIHYKLGEVKAAEEAFRRAVDLNEKLADDFPDKLEYRQRQAGSQNNLGVLLAATGRPKEAETAYRGALALRKQLVADFPNEPSCRQDLAISYNTLGNLLENTGRPKEAEALLRDAVALQKQLVADAPTKSEYRRDLAVSYYNLAPLLRGKDRSKEAEAITRDAVALRKQLAAEFPTKPEYRQDLARSYNSLGTLLKNTGRPKEAEEAYHAALALQQQLAADFPTKPEYRQMVAVMHQNLAILLATTGRPQEAEAAFRDSLTVKKQLAADYPTMTTYRQDLATGYSNLGVLLYETGRLKESEAAYRDALTIKKQLGAEFPTMPGYSADVALSLYNLGILLKQTNRPAEAEAAYRDSIALFKQLAADLPTDPEYRKNLAKSYSGLGGLLMTIKRSQDAEAGFREALALHKQLAADFPTVPEHRQDVGGTSNNLGVFLKGIGRTSEAETAYREALALRKQLAADFPTMHHYQYELAATMVNLAELWRDRKEFAQARELLEQAQSHLQTALKANPRHPYYREVFRTHHVALATALAGLGEHTQAAATAEQLARLGWEPADDTYSAACALALCVPLAEKDDRLAATERKERVGVYAERALALLREAVVKGYKDFDHLKKDTDLDPLRARPEFQELLRELEKGDRGAK
jgi:serine/threonine-protein kinase